MVRNPMILKILFLSDDVESYSSGFKRVYDECKKNNVPVDYIIAQEGFTFIFRRFDINKSQKRVLSDEEKRIIELLKENPYISAESLSDMFNKSPRSIQRILASLKADGFIERVGYTKGYWIVY